MSREETVAGELCDLEKVLRDTTGVFSMGFVDLYQQGSNDVIVLRADDQARQKSPIYLLIALCHGIFLGMHTRWESG